MNHQQRNRIHRPAGKDQPVAVSMKKYGPTEAFAVS